MRVKTGLSSLLLLAVFLVPVTSAVTFSSDTTLCGDVTDNNGNLYNNVTVESGGNITSAEADNLSKELDGIPVYENGELVKTTDPGGNVIVR